MNIQDSDLSLIVDVARTLVSLDEIDDLRTFSLPYSELAQRTLDRVVLTCLRDEADPPASLPDLVRWCHERSLDRWPLDLPADVLPPGSRLLDPRSGLLTDLCLELAHSVQAMSPLSAAAGLLSSRADLRRTGNQRFYRDFRRFLIETPVLDERTEQRVRWDQRIGPFTDLITEVYREAPARLRKRGVFRGCATCGYLMAPAAKDHWRCERDECGSAGGRIWEAAAGVQQPPRAHRQFIGGPARTTLRLWHRLEKAAGPGTRLEPWPEFGDHDLSISRPDKHEPITVRVVDWSNPSLLGMAARDVPVQETFWVIPDHRIAREHQYLETATREAGTGGPRFCTESGLVYRIVDLDRKGSSRA